MQHHKTICPVSFPFSSSIGDPGALSKQQNQKFLRISMRDLAWKFKLPLACFLNNVFKQKQFNIRLNASHLQKIKNRLKCNLRHASKAWKQCVPRFCYDAIRLLLMHLMLESKGVFMSSPTFFSIEIRRMS